MWCRSGRERRWTRSGLGQQSPDPPGLIPSPQVEGPEKLGQQQAEGLDDPGDGQEVLGRRHGGKRVLRQRSFQRAFFRRRPVFFPRPDFLRAGDFLDAFFLRLGRTTFSVSVSPFESWRFR